MDRSVVAKAPLPWWLAGILLGLVQVLAVAVHKPLGVSTQFVVADANIVSHVVPAYAEGNPEVKRRQSIGYGWWLVVGMVVGAAGAALATRRWKIRKTTVWWQTNRGRSTATRLVACLVGGFLILLGSRLAHGCTSGQFASGWAQLSLSAVPFTVTLFGFGMLTAYLVHPRTPTIEL